MSQAIDSPKSKLMRSIARLARRILDTMDREHTARDKYWAKEKSKVKP